ncbi:MAG: ABC-2 family transporter protein, partial [Cyanobacteria bacterium P01_F01_bin.42]
YRVFFTFVVPITFLTTVPAQVMLNRADGWWVIGSGTLAACLLFVANRFWRFALRFYTSASS